MPLQYPWKGYEILHDSSGPKGRNTRAVLGSMISRQEPSIDRRLSVILPSHVVRRRRHFPTSDNETARIRLKHPSKWLQGRVGVGIEPRLRVSRSTSIPSPRSFMP